MNGGIGGRDRFFAALPLSPRSPITANQRSGYGEFLVVTAGAGVVVRVPTTIARVPQIVMVCDAGTAQQPRITVHARDASGISVSGDVAMAGVVLYVA